MKKLIFLLFFFLAIGMPPGLKAQNNQGNQTQNVTLTQTQVTIILEAAAKEFYLTYGIKLTLSEWLRLHQTCQCRIECLAPKTYRVSLVSGISTTVLADF